jgi:hypothetical protein
MATDHDAAYRERVSGARTFEPLVLPPQEERTAEWYREHVLPRLNVRGLEAIVQAAIRPQSEDETA